jgi:hypothetical protein
VKRFLGLLLLLPLAVLAATLVWNQNPQPVSGYRVYYGPLSRFYTASYDAGLRTNLPMNVLPVGALFIAATAYSASQESDFSAEILVINATNRWRVTYRINMATNLGGPWSNVLTVLLTNLPASQTYYRADVNAIPLP